LTKFIQTIELYGLNNLVIIQFKVNKHRLLIPNIIFDVCIDPLVIQLLMGFQEQLHLIYLVYQ